MDLLAESEHYMVYGEYENVMMIIKASQKKILIGDFYGNPQGAPRGGENHPADHPRPLGRSECAAGLHHERRAAERPGTGVNPGRSWICRENFFFALCVKPRNRSVILHSERRTQIFPPCKTIPPSKNGPFAGGRQGRQIAGDEGVC